ncbi:MAG: hypothetical protein PHI85_06045 [Victivallaceae bacterium]|nr:hypothetical protein [Victivallaceae bacterium]
MADIKRPTFLLMIGAMLLVLGALSSLVSTLRGEKDAAKELEALDSVSRSGEPAATTNFEQAVNRYVESDPPLAILGPNDPAAVEKYLANNAPVFPYLDNAVKARRIMFRRNWNRGFGVERLGVIDVHNLVKLNWFRLLAASDPSEAARLAAANRTLANFLKYDPMVSSVRIYAPAYHLYLFSLEAAAGKGAWTDEADIRDIIDALEQDEAEYPRVFAEALRSERKLLGQLPESLNAYDANPGTDVKTVDTNLATEKLSRMALLLEEDFSRNAAELKGWTVPSGDNFKISGKLVPGRDYAESLAALQNHNRLARMALAAKAGFPAPPLTDAFTGEQLRIATGRNGITASTADPKDPAESFTLK